MKKYFSQLRPLERRLAVGVWSLFCHRAELRGIWPHFSDWGKLRRRLNDAQKKLNLYQATVGANGLSGDR